jgi:hypothetical protein
VSERAENWKKRGFSVVSMSEKDTDCSIGMESADATTRISSFYLKSEACSCFAAVHFTYPIEQRKTFLAVANPILSSIRNRDNWDAGRIDSASLSFDDFPPYRRDTAECGSYFANIFDKGPIAYSCRYTELARLQISGQPIRKFVGTACARGETEALAGFNARTHAKDLVTAMQLKDKVIQGAKPESNEIYVPVKSDYRCVRLGGPTQSDDGQEVEEADVVAPPARPQRPDRVSFVLKNDDRYTLGLEFTSSNPQRTWPGSNKQYNLAVEETYNLECVPGQKICFGAWRENQSKTWGVGRNGSQACTNCCATCGNTFKTTLTDAGADAPLRSPNVATFTIHNKDRYRLGLEFTSQSRSAAWPGGNRQYNVSGTSTYNLTCQPGEKICFGAWRDHQTTVWGVGRNNSQGCQRCCVSCGGTFETTLTDGGPDSYPSGGGGGGALVGNILGGAISVLGGLAAGGAFSPPPQTYRGNNTRQRPSDISGTR